jgi:hypothetical protein
MATFEGVADFSSVVDAEDDCVEAFGHFGHRPQEACPCAEGFVVVGDRVERVEVIVDWMPGGVLMVMKMTNILTTAKRLARMRMSAGGSRKALAPMSTARLKMETRSMRGP